jgi:hypothetical protein
MRAPGKHDFKRFFLVSNEPPPVPPPAPFARHLPRAAGRNLIFLLPARLIMATRTHRKTTNILGNDTIKSVKVRVV